MRLIAFGLLLCALTASAEQRLVSIGERRLSIDCSGERSSTGTVVLLAGGGRTLKDWAKVQPEVAKFARVCSYDRAGLGESEKPAKPQSAAEIVDDLHRLLDAAGEKPPYVLAGHSIAGIYARWFTARFPAAVKGLVMVDSSHEEQVWRLDEIAPNGSGGVNPAFADTFYPKGQRLEWRTNVPMVVLCQGKPGAPIPRLTKEQNEGFARTWRELQEDMAKRSPKGRFQLAEQSGHYIHTDQPELVIQAIREVF